jgi:hypothetical protein
MLEGVGIRFKMDGYDRDVVGFYTTRMVSAANELDAVLSAKNMIGSEWSKGGEYSSLNCGGDPDLSLVSVKKMHVLSWFFSRKAKGYTFYLSED